MEYNLVLSFESQQFVKHFLRNCQKISEFSSYALNFIVRKIEIALCDSKPCFYERYEIFNL